MRPNPHSAPRPGASQYASAGEVDSVNAAGSNVEQGDRGVVNGSPLIAKIAQGHAQLVELFGEFDVFCASLTDAQCRGCSLDQGECELDHLLIRFLNMATAHVRLEQELINQHRDNPRYAVALGEHLLSHDLLINDLSSFVMDCGRYPTAELVFAAAALLKYWIECHMATHDKLLLDIVSGTADAS